MVKEGLWGERLMVDRGSGRRVDGEKFWLIGKGCWRNILHFVSGVRLMGGLKEGCG